MIAALLDLLRIATYLWVASECLFLAHLYWFGYIRYRRSPIILSMFRLFIALGIMFLYTSFLPVVKFFDVQIYLSLTNGSTIFLLLVGWALTDFRHQSLTEQKIDKQAEK
jgi:hypothetical protein